MTHRNGQAIRILIPPEFAYLPCLFLPDPERARWVAAVWKLACRLRSEGYEVSVDAGTDAATAAETAAKLESDRITRAVVTGLPCDAKAMKILMDVVSPGKVRIASPVVRPIRGDDALVHLEKTIRERTEPAKIPIEGTDISIDRNPPFMIFEPGEPDPLPDSYFIREGNRFLKSGAEISGFPLQSIDEIRTIDAAHPFGASPDPDKRILFAFPMAEAIDDPEAAFETCERLIGDVGPDSFRLIPLSESVACGGAEWAARLGLHLDSMRNFLVMLTSKHAPSWNVYLNVVNLFHALGEDPFEEMYAGNSLADRNAELIENIVP